MDGDKAMFSRICSLALLTQINGRQKTPTSSA
jgi:hypothetical protein